MDKYLLSERYIRQTSLPAIGQAGQLLLDKSRIAVIGAGGLASSLAFALAGAGIGHITIVDFDKVALSNLNRQFLYRLKDIGRFKAKLAARRLQDYRPDLSVKVIIKKLDERNAVEIIAGHDMVVSAVDNLHTRYIINQAACKSGIMFSDAAVSSFGGYSMLVEPGKSACYECFQGPEHEHQDISSIAAQAEGSVLGTVATLVGALQADMIIENLIGINEVEAGTVVFYDGRRHSIEQLLVIKDSNCRACSGI